MVGSFESSRTEMALRNVDRTSFSIDWRVKENFSLRQLFFVNAIAILTVRMDR